MSDYYEKWLALSKEDRWKVSVIENDMSFSGDDPIVCPYCNTNQDIYEPELPYEQDEETNLKCDYFDCGKTFTLTAQVSYSWTTQVPDEEAMAIFEANTSNKGGEE